MLLSNHCTGAQKKAYSLDPRVCDQACLAYLIIISPPCNVNRENIHFGKCGICLTDNSLLIVRNLPLKENQIRFPFFCI